MTGPLLRVRSLTVRYPVRARRWLGPRRSMTAVDGVDLDVAAGQALGIVGESGCGKSTLARAVLALLTPAAGTVEWRGEPVHREDPATLRRMRREMQVVFQDPVGSLDPRMTIGESVLEALEALAGPQSRGDADARVAAALEETGLDAQLARRYPHELSGGQCQRAAIARAIVARPCLLICDEAVSALDVSVQAQIVNLLGDLQRRHGLALMFVSHNLAVVRQLCEDVVVMYQGRIVERASSAALYAGPRHPYTRALLAAVPQPDPSAPRPPVAFVPQAPEELTDRAPQVGCAYAPRCPHADGLCRARAPVLEDGTDGHATACHHWAGIVATIETRTPGAAARTDSTPAG